MNTDFVERARKIIEWIRQHPKACTDTQAQVDFGLGPIGYYDTTGSEYFSLILDKMTLTVASGRVPKLEFAANAGYDLEHLPLSKWFDAIEALIPPEGFGTPREIIIDRVRFVREEKKV